MPFSSERRVGGVFVELVYGLFLDLLKLLRRRRGIAHLHVLHLDERLEPTGAGNVIVCLEYSGQQRLPKPTRTQKHRVARCL